MKKTAYFLFCLSLFLISSFSGFSQITLYSETFDASAIHGTSLNDSGVSDHNAHSFTNQDYLYTFDNPNHSGSTASSADWLSVASHVAYYGTEPTMTGYRAGILNTDANRQDQNLITPTWTATRSIMTISFSYCYRDAWGSNGLEIYLQSRSGTDDFTNIQTLVAAYSDASVDYSSGNIVVTPGYEYRLVFHYYGWDDYGASFDTILVQHPDLTDLTVSSDTTISNSQSYANLTVNAGITLTIAKTGNLTVTTDITNNGTIVLESDSNEFASMIYGGSSSETITYKRYVNAVGTDEWDLIGSPVDGLSISSFASTNTSGTATLAQNLAQYAIGLFDNSDNTWDNLTSDGSGAGNVSAAGNFDIGKGYAMASVSGGTGLLVFTGTIAVVDQTQAIINNDAASSGAGSRWDLVANPFPSFINANNDADETDNFLTVNTAKLDDTYEAVYGYDADGSGYTTYNHAYNTNKAVYIAPGQGFFVASDDTNSDTVSFTEAMQVVIGTDDFITGDTMDDVFEVLLRLYHGDQEIAETRLYFEDGLSLGLNPGYDAGAFDENAALMTRLVEEDEGHGLVINAMSPEDMDDVVIPLEINQTAGQEFKINLHTSTIGEVNVYLEDTELETLTLLNEEDFVMTPTSDLSDAGRFYVHLTADTLSNEEVNTSLLNAYKGVDNNYITIEGLATQATSTEVSLYNILGTKVMDTTLDNTTNTQMISTNGFATGIYVLKLASGEDQLTKKLIIK